MAGGESASEKGRSEWYAIDTAGAEAQGASLSDFLCGGDSAGHLMNSERPELTPILISLPQHQIWDQENCLLSLQMGERWLVPIALSGSQEPV